MCSSRSSNVRDVDEGKGSAPCLTAAGPAVLSMVVVLLMSSCSSDSPSAPTPTAQAVALAVGSMRAIPAGVGVVHNTDFAFEAVGTFPAATSFAWQFGDGSSATTSTPTATHVYSQVGNFGVVVEARAGSSSGTATNPVTVRSLIGRWHGTVTGHTVVPRQRPIPITSFDLTINNAPRPATPTGIVELSASWADDAGCRRDRLIVQSFTPRPAAEVNISIESLSLQRRRFLDERNRRREVRPRRRHLPERGSNLPFPDDAPVSVGDERPSS